jgi:uncharacterized RDD family membrane protein YckC
LIPGGSVVISETQPDRSSSLDEIPISTVNVAPQKSLALRYASPMSRLLAAIIDGLILIIPWIFASHIVPVLGGFLVSFFYSPVLEASELRATIGKYVMGIQVQRPTGERISHKSAIIRYFMKFVSSACLFLGHILMLFTEHRQALHDLLAETVVVYGKDEDVTLADVWTGAVKELFGGAGLDLAENARIRKLEKLQELRERGVLTEEEFQAEKSKILRS